MNVIRTLQEQLEQAEARERELQHKLDELTDFVENASLPLQAANGSGIIIWVNQAYLDMLGYLRDECLNKHIGNFFADADTGEDILHRLLNREILRNFYARMKHRDGSIRHVLINSSLYQKHGELLQTRCFVQDVTDIQLADDRKDKRIAELEEQNRSLCEQLA